MHTDDLTGRRSLEDLAIGVVDPDGPGAVVGVLAGGELRSVAARGLANIEHQAPITRDTVFHVASLSKQFTAYAVAQLGEENRLGLDDPVAAHLDWFPFGDITLRHLVHHVSGLRDQWALTVLSGRRMEDVITTEDIVALVARQRELNFPPGSQYSYSNTGYTLLGSVVEAVSGKRLREFCAERIFGPLGMTSTAFLDDHHEVTPRRADSYYRRADGSYGRLALSYSNAGATSLNTTVDDLARWARHTMTPDARSLLERCCTLTDGTELRYAFGVIAGAYRGRHSLAHSGADAGYRAQLLVLPDDGAAAIVLSNSADLPAGRLARRALDRLLPPRDDADDADDAERTPVSGDVTGLTGRYLDDDADVVYALCPAGDGFTLRFGTSALPLSLGARGRLVDDVLGFEVESTAAGIVVRPDHGAPRHCRRLQPAAADAADATYAGMFYSAELDAVFQVEAPEDGGLRLRFSGRSTVGLRPLEPDLFLAAVPSPTGRGDALVTVRFSADRAELRLGHPQARRIRCVRLA